MSRTPERLELWEDGRRIPEEYVSSAFDWWYFDATLDDGSTVIFVFMIDSDHRRDAYIYRVVVELLGADGSHLLAASRTWDDVEIVKDRPEVRIGRSSMKGDIDSYHVVVDPEDLGGRVGLDVRLRRTCPSRLSPADRESVVQGEQTFGWISTMPRGELTGTLTVDGESREVTGAVYHDKNWGSTSMAHTMHHWLWLRVAVGPYTAVYFCQYPTAPYAVGEPGLQELFVASGEEVLVNVEGPGVAPLTTPTEPSPDPRNSSCFYVPGLTVSADADGRKVTLEVESGPFIGSLALAKETMFLTLEDVARAKEMDNPPWYNRFVARARLTVESASGGESETHTGEGIIEFMDLHLHD